MNTNSDITPEEFEMLEQYVLEKLPIAEQESVTKRLEADAVLRQKLYSVQLLLLGVQEASLNKKMEQFHQDIRSVKKNSSSSHRKIYSMRIWLAAASVIIIATLGALLYFNSSTSDSKLFSTYYKPDPGLIGTMSVSDNYLFDRAMIDYKTGEYAKAISAWESLLKTHPANDTINYFLGSAYLAFDKNAKAIDYFRIVTNQQESYFYKDACWYIGLALLKNDEKKEAISFIEKSNHENKEKLLLKLKDK
ncbi:MAG: tetratricopeptide repeat protein [Ginsengibacter sp.]